MWNILRKLWDRASGVLTGGASASRRGTGSDPQPAGGLPPLIGKPEEGKPYVAFPSGKMLVITDRMTYEYQQGLTPGGDPSQIELDRVLSRADRIRVLNGGMMRDAALGCDVLLDSRDRSEIQRLRQVLRISEDPASFAHCNCLGGPTVEWYEAGALVATLSLHHGHAFRWVAWKHDAKVADPAALRSWLSRHEIDSDPGKHSGDPSQFGLLGLSEAERHAFRGQSHLARHENQHALAECELAVRLDPECAVAHGVRALAHRMAARGEECERDADNAIRLGLKHPEVYAARGVARAARGALDAALADCDAALELAPESAHIHNSRGCMRCEVGRHEEALADFDRAIELAPEWPLVRRHRASLLFQQRRLEDAREEITRAIELMEQLKERDPSAFQSISEAPLSTYYIDRAQTLAVLGEPDEAASDLDRAVDLDPERPIVFLARGGFRLQTGQIESALNDFSTAVELRPDLAEGYLQRALAHQAMGEPGEALSDLDEGLLWSPEDARLILTRGQTLLAMRRFDEARRSFNRVVALFPDAPFAYHARSCCHAASEEYAEQLADLERCVELAPEWSLALNSLAWLLSTCPDPDFRDGVRAVGYGTRAVEHAHPFERAAALDTLAAALAEAGRFEEAVERQEAAIELMEDPERRGPYEDRLALYRAGEPYRQNGVEG